MAESMKARIRYDRKKVTCLKCHMEINKDNINTHWQRKHPDEHRKGVKPQFRPYGSKNLIERSVLEQFTQVASNASMPVGSSSPKRKLAKSGNSGDTLKSEMDTEATSNEIALSSSQAVHRAAHKALTKSKIPVWELPKSSKTVDTSVPPGIVSETKPGFSGSSTQQSSKVKTIQGKKLELFQKYTRKGDDDNQSGQSSSATQISSKFTDKGFLLTSHSIPTEKIFMSLRLSDSTLEAKNILFPYRTELERIKLLCQQQEPVLYSENLAINAFGQSQLSDKVRSELRIIVTKSDGNCWYSAFSTALFGSSSHAPLLRLIQIQHMIEEKDSLQQISKAVFGSSFENIFKETKTLAMRSDEGWGQEANTFMMSEILNRPIIIHSPSPRKNSEGMSVLYNSNPENLDKVPIYICHRTFHFEPLIPLRLPVTSIQIQKCVKSHANVRHKYEYIRGEEMAQQVLTAEQLESLKESQVEAWEIHERMQKIEQAINQQESRGLDYESEKKPIPIPGEMIELEKTDEGNNMYKIVTQKNDDYSPMDTANSSSETPSSGPDDLSKINKKINNLTSMISALTTDTFRKLDSPQVVIISKDLDGLTSIQQIMENYPFLKTRINDEMEIFGDDVFNEIICELCHDDSRLNRTGCFEYHSTAGVEFLHGNQSQQFRHLKMSIRRHLKSDQHKIALGEQENESKENTLLQEKNFKTGMLLGGYAYQAIKTDHNISKYEEYVALAAARCEPIGQLNHSDDFCRSFCDCVYACLKEELENVLSTPLPSTGRFPAFAIIADKYTPDRRCGQIVGIVLFIGGKIVDVNLDYARVTKYDGLGIAKLLRSSLNKFLDDETVRSRLVGGCFDGEYFHKSVPKRLMESECFGIKEECKSWYSWDWDKPHILERAMNNAKEECELFQRIDDTVHKMNKHFRVGKGYTEAEFAADAANVTFYAPLQSSETKFTAHQLRVLSNFSRNYPTFYQLLNSKRHKDLQLIDNAEFVIGLAIEMDILETITSFSKICQQIGLNSWRMHDAVQNSFAELEDMVRSIDPDAMVFHPNFKKLKDLHSELNNPNPTYKGMHIRFTSNPMSPAHVSNFNTLVMKMKPEVLTFIDKLKSAYMSRAVPNVPKTYSLVEASFRLEKVLSYAESQTVPDEFIKYFRLANSAGYLYGYQDDEEAIKQQYLLFINEVKSLNDAMCSIRPNEQFSFKLLEEKIFYKIIGSNSPNDFPDVTDLLLSAMVRTHCEAVCEGMGSIIKDVAHERALGFDNVQKEMFVTYNGPQPYEDAAQKLVRDALDLRFGPQKWHFHVKTQRGSLLKHFVHSPVVDRKIQEAKEKTRLAYTGKRKK